MKEIKIVLLFLTLIVLPSALSVFVIDSHVYKEGFRISIQLPPQYAFDPTKFKVTVTDTTDVKDCQYVGVVGSGDTVVYQIPDLRQAVVDTNGDGLPDRPLKRTKSNTIDKKYSLVILDQATTNPSQSFDLEYITPSVTALPNNIILEGMKSFKFIGLDLFYPNFAPKITIIDMIDPNKLYDCFVTQRVSKDEIQCDSSLQTIPLGDYTVNFEYPGSSIKLKSLLKIFNLGQTKSVDCKVQQLTGDNEIKCSLDTPAEFEDGVVNAIVTINGNTLTEFQQFKFFVPKFKDSMVSEFIGDMTGGEMFEIEGTNLDPSGTVYFETLNTQVKCIFKKAVPQQTDFDSYECFAPTFFPTTDPALWLYSIKAKMYGRDYTTVYTFQYNYPKIDNTQTSMPIINKGSSIVTIKGDHLTMVNKVDLNGITINPNDYQTTANSINIEIDSQALSVTKTIKFFVEKVQIGAATPLLFEVVQNIDFKLVSPSIKARDDKSLSIYFLDDPTTKSILFDLIDFPENQDYSIMLGDDELKCEPDTNISPTPIKCNGIKPTTELTLPKEYPFKIVFDPTNVKPNFIKVFDTLLKFKYIGYLRLVNGERLDAANSISIGESMIPIDNVLTIKRVNSPDLFVTGRVLSNNAQSLKMLIDRNTVQYSDDLFIISMVGLYQSHTPTTVTFFDIDLTTDEVLPTTTTIRGIFISQKDHLGTILVEGDYDYNSMLLTVDTVTYDISLIKQVKSVYSISLSTVGLDPPTNNYPTNPPRAMIEIELFGVTYLNNVVQFPTDRSFILQVDFDNIKESGCLLVTPVGNKQSIACALPPPNSKDLEIRPLKYLIGQKTITTDISIEFKVPRIISATPLFGSKYNDDLLTITYTKGDIQFIEIRLIKLSGVTIVLQSCTVETAVPGTTNQFQMTCTKPLGRDSGNYLIQVIDKQTKMIYSLERIYFNNYGISCLGQADGPVNQYNNKPVSWWFTYKLGKRGTFDQNDYNSYLYMDESTDSIVMKEHLTPISKKYGGVQQQFDRNQKLSPLAATFKQLDATNTYYYFWNDQYGARDSDGARGNEKSADNYAHAKDGVAKGIHVTHSNPVFPSLNGRFYDHFAAAPSYPSKWLGKADNGQNFFCYNFEDLGSVVDDMVKTGVFLLDPVDGNRVPDNTIMCRGNIPCVDLYRLGNRLSILSRYQTYIDGCTNRIRDIYDRRLDEIARAVNDQSFINKLIGNRLTLAQIRTLNINHPPQRYQNLENHCYWMSESKIKGIQRPSITKTLKSFPKPNINIPNDIRDNVFAIESGNDYTLANPLIPWEIVNKVGHLKYDGVDIFEVIATLYYKRKFFVQTWNTGSSQLPVYQVLPLNQITHLQFNDDLMRRRDSQNNLLGTSWPRPSYSGAGQDHSKFMIDAFPYEVENAAICFGDGNRHNKQPERGGGAVCFEDDQLVRQLFSFIRGYSIKTHGNEEINKYKDGRIFSHLVDQNIRIDVRNFIGDVKLAVKRGNGHPFIPEVPITRHIINGPVNTMKQIDTQIRVVRTISPFPNDAASPNLEEVSVLKPYVAQYLWTPVVPPASEPPGRKSVKTYAEATHMTLEYLSMDPVGLTINSIDSLQLCGNDLTSAIDNQMRQCLDDNPISTRITYNGVNPTFANDNQIVLAHQQYFTASDSRSYILDSTTNYEFGITSFIPKFKSTIADVTSRFNIIIDSSIVPISQYNYPFIYYKQTVSIQKDITLVYFLLTQKIMNHEKYTTISKNNDQWGNAVIMVISKFVHTLINNPMNPIPSPDFSSFSLIVPITTINDISIKPNDNDNDFTKVAYLIWKLMTQQVNPLSFSDILADLDLFKSTTTVDLYERYKPKINPPDPNIEKLFKPAPAIGVTGTRSSKLGAQIKQATSSQLAALLESTLIDPKDIFDLDSHETKQLSDSLDMWAENRMISSLFGSSHSNEIKYLDEFYRVSLKNGLCPHYSINSITHYQICRAMSIVEFTNIIRYTQQSLKSVKYSFGELEYSFSPMSINFKSIFLDTNSFDGILIASINSKLCDIKLIRQSQLRNIESIDICKIPVINNIIPSNTSNNNLITINGFNFYPTTQISISSEYQCLSQQFLNSTNIVCEMPDLMDNNNIVVRVDNVVNDQSSFYVTNKCPIINDIVIQTTDELLSSLGGDIIEIKGNYFGNSLLNTQVFFEHQQCFIIKIEDTSIQCVTPPHFGINIPIRIKTRNCPNIQSNDQRISFSNPTISTGQSIDSFKFPGDSILLSGSFGSSPQLYLEEKLYSFELINAETIKFTIPNDVLIPFSALPLKIKCRNSQAIYWLSLSSGYFAPRSIPLIVPTKGMDVIFDGDSFGLSSSEIDNITLSNGAKLIGCHRHQYFMECSVPPGIGSILSVTVNIKSALYNFNEIKSPSNYISYEHPSIENYIMDSTKITIKGRNFVPVGVSPLASNIYFSNTQTNWMICQNTTFVDDQTMVCNQIPTLDYQTQFNTYVNVGGQTSNIISGKVTFVQGYVYLDSNFNNAKDSNEQIFTNCRVTLSIDSIDKYVASCDTKGYYFFTSITPGIYELSASINSATKYFIIISTSMLNVSQSQFIQQDIGAVEDTGYNCYATFNSLTSPYKLTLPYGAYDLSYYEWCSGLDVCKYTISNVVMSSSDCTWNILSNSKISITYSSTITLNFKRDNLVPPGFDSTPFSDSSISAEIRFSFYQKQYIFKQYNQDSQIIFRVPVVKSMVNIQTANQTQISVLNNFAITAPSTMTIPIFIWKNTQILPVVLYDKSNGQGSTLTLPPGYHNEYTLNHLSWVSRAMSISIPPQYLVHIDHDIVTGVPTISYSGDPSTQFVNFINVISKTIEISYKSMFDRLSFTGGYHSFLNTYIDQTLIQFLIGDDQLMCTNTQCYFTSDVGPNVVNIKYNGIKIYTNYTVTYTSPYGDLNQYPYLDTKNATKDRLKINQYLQVKNGSTVISQISFDSNGLSVISVGSALLRITPLMYSSSSCIGEDQLVFRDGVLCIFTVRNNQQYCTRWCLNNENLKARYLRLLPYGIVLQNEQMEVIYVKYQADNIASVVSQDYKRRFINPRVYSTVQLDNQNPNNNTLYAYGSGSPSVLTNGIHYMILDASFCQLRIYSDMKFGVGSQLLFISSYVVAPGVPTTNCKLNFGLDGNLCATTPDATKIVWCAYTQQLGGRYFGLPPAYTSSQIGFYMTNSKGRMVYGRFANLMETSELKMIPGSFIVESTQEFYPDIEDRKINVGAFITNGESYLRLESNGQLKLYDSNPYNTIGSPLPKVMWSSFVAFSAPYNGPMYAELRLSSITICTPTSTFSGGKLAVTNAFASVLHLSWMAMNKENDWGLLFLSSETKIISGHLPIPGQINNFIPVNTITKDSFENDYVRFRLNSQPGIIDLYHLQTNLVVWSSLTTNIPARSSCANYKSDFLNNSTLPQLCLYTSIGSPVNCNYSGAYWCQQFSLGTTYLQTASSIPELIATKDDGRITWTANSIKYAKLTK
ncbi:hypothetical protein PPL_02323 [Heterostelium album PN500]|uniref:IPT/TIG domain-containing protein n=1 Tax=Heterostelium pallidum (strain ATCC 26659 / Pp 5 / PN500) TaxID=670386 RepID=D3B1Z8_HETP5|nr:hypothetical protein PPL_02323 [Heterostelium album PN500]EFA85322.1 hypothetical protein PPL_02323 [Heterostelium album PN500]|eukprot:XP_020437431.1 hypothetical protein PPL_02323 [Heterostelium album PN500]